MSDGNPMLNTAKNLIEKVGEKNVYDTFSKHMGYATTPPMMHEFIDSDEWLGKAVGGNLYPPWRSALYDIYPNPLRSPYSEVICTGAIGTGKTTVGILGSLYDLVRFTCLDKPQEHFGLLPTTKIAYAILNVTLGLAGDVIWDQLFQLMHTSPRIRHMIDRHKTNQSKLTDRTLFPKGVDIFIGSRPTHALGMAIVGAVLDEVNFHHSAEKAYENYAAVKARIESRFMQSDGSFPGRVWMLSSKKNEQDFLEDHISKSEDNVQTKVYSYPLWEIQRHKPNVKYSGRTFPVFIGDKHRDPMILTGPGSSYGITDDLVMQVPMEHKERFDYDLNTALRDIAGVALGSIFKFIPSVEVLNRALCLPNPVRKEIVPLDFQDRSDLLINYLDFQRLIVPQWKDSPRHIHVDLAVRKDKCGIASSFVSDTVTTRKVDPFTGIELVMSEPQFITEFALGVMAKGGSEIPFYKIKEFMVALSREGYPIAKVTFDGFQSVNLRQDLNLMGIPSEELSCDKTKDPYECWKDALLQGRWLGPKFELLKKECGELVDVGKKIDHPVKDGSKDISDGVAGSVYSAYQTYMKFPHIHQLKETIAARDRHGNSRLSQVH